MLNREEKDGCKFLKKSNVAVDNYATTAGGGLTYIGTETTTMFPLRAFSILMYSRL